MDERTISKQLVEARVAVLKKYPFFGRLLLKLRLGLAACGTAFTDMRRVVFDPAFAQRLSAEEVQYVMVHEVLHCALRHCTRAKGKQHFIYNVACDIVVNSMMLEMYRKEEITIDGEPLMHLAPNGFEGREYTAEQVYAMLMKMSQKAFEQAYGGSNTDNHDVWNELDDVSLEDLWKHHLRETVAACGVSGGIPQLMARYLKEVDHAPRTNWRQILHDFIQCAESDYDFSRPDKRYSYEAILPSFCENADGSKVENLWFFVDTSGSVSDEAVSVAYEEIKQATAQIDRLSGRLSFFDHAVADPQPFETLEDILDMKPVGGGGTNFCAVFDKVADYAEGEGLPSVIVIITDGYAFFPDEEAALGVPVIWIIVDSEVTPPWGAYAYIST